MNEPPTRESGDLEEVVTLRDASLVSRHPSFESN